MSQKRENKHDKTLLAKWCEVKNRISASLKHPKIKTREVVWLRIGYNIGAEINGKGEEFTRPVLVLKTYPIKTSMVLPLTSKNKSDNKHYVYVGKIKDKDAYGVLSQVRIVDNTRFSRKIVRVSEKKFSEIFNKYIEYLKE